MADKKISALTSATLPLAGTEVFPLVQSSATVKTPVSSVLNQSGTEANVKALTATGALASLTASSVAADVFGGGARIFGVGANTSTAGTLKLITASTNASVYNENIVLNANGTSTFGDNLVQGTAAKGVNFTANTPAAGMTSQLLNWYEEGTWTPAIIGSSTAGTGTYTLQEGHYTRIGRQVTVTCAITWTTHTGTGAIRVNGLPFTIKNDNVYAAFALEYDNLTVSANAIAVIVTRPGQTYLQVDQTVAGGSTQTGVSMDTAASLWFSATYFV